ncbi:MAG: hypothetical protein AAF822_03360 [Pseudomonadota bacterium]
MIREVSVPQGQWTAIGTGPHALHWARGRLRICIDTTPPTDPQDSLLLSAQGQVKSFSYNGLETVFVMSLEGDVTLHAVQVTSSELFLVDAAGNVLLDGV